MMKTFLIVKSRIPWLYCMPSEHTNHGIALKVLACLNYLYKVEKPQKKKGQKDW